MKELVLLLICADRMLANFCAPAAEIVRVAFAPLARNGRSRHFRQKNTMVLVYFFRASETSLCCDDRAWHLRHSAAKWKEISVFAFGGPLGSSWGSLGASWVPLGASWGTLGVSWVPPGAFWMPLGCLLGASF